MSAARVLARRIDALTIAFSVDLDPEAKATLERRGALAEENKGKAAFSLHGLECEIQVTRKKKWWFFKNADMRATLDLQIAANDGGWNIEVVLDARYLAAQAHDFGAGIELARKVAGSFGTIRAERLRRFDICADFAGFNMTDRMCDKWLMPKGGKKMTGYVVDADTGRQTKKLTKVVSTIGEYRNARKVTGNVICPGNTIVNRTYDKTEEVCLAGGSRPAKKSLEFAQWRAAGWHNDRSLDQLLKMKSKELDQVVRVEFQLRGVVLDEMKLRNPADLVSRMDSVWQRLTRWWTRLLVPTVGPKGKLLRRTNWVNDPRWDVVQEVSFKTPNAEVIERHRVRGGATLEQAWGAMTSALAARGALSPVIVPGTEVELTASMSKEQARGLVYRIILDACMTFGNVFAEYALGKGIPAEVAQMMVTRMLGTRARFASSLDDQQATHAWEIDPVEGSSPPVFLVSAAPPRAAPACGWMEYAERLSIESG